MKGDNLGPTYMYIKGDNSRGNNYLLRTGFVSVI